jgi:hypothetical protein
VVKPRLRSEVALIGNDMRLNNLLQIGFTQEEEEQKKIPLLKEEAVEKSNSHLSEISFCRN